jgi:hypothetical protein
MKPHITIGIDYLERWHVIPKNRLCNVYLHKFSGSDDDRALHDHPWHSVSFLLKGRLRAVTTSVICNKTIFVNTLVPKFKPVVRHATHAHRLVLVGDKPAYTLFITGPRIREWGFHCKSGWKHWTKMSTADGKPIGGCGD